MDNDYKMIGTSKEAVNYRIKMERLSQEDVIAFIKEKTDDAIKLKERQIHTAEETNDRAKVEELKNEIIDTINASKRIIQEQLQGNNTCKIEEKKKKEKTEKSPYEVLDCSREDFLKLKPEEVNLILEMRTKAKIRKISKKLESIPKSRYTERMNLKKQILEIEDAYEKVKSEDNREAYDNLAQKRIGEDFENLRAAVEKARNEIKGDAEECER